MNIHAGATNSMFLELDTFLDLSFCRITFSFFPFFLQKNMYICEIGWNNVINPFVIFEGQNDSFY